ncbi:MAG: N-acetyl-gamma-glutamyl-phosphate reductase [Candidatus Brocadiae bacterium]|nr:N-acetyl-gamma-glutamyl-phosphate reductase [Candidatus Brocadiia bacterium]
MPPRKTVAVLGASGYAGLELARLLRGHAGVEVVALQSESSAGQPVRSIAPDWPGEEAFSRETPEGLAKLGLDLVFFATGDGIARSLAPAFTKSKVVDLSRDWRADWVYGLPEMFRGRIIEADAIANPGCYATACALAAWPLVREGLVERVVFDGKSGYSGAGRRPNERNNPEALSENVLPYHLSKHAHVAEIEKALGMRVHFTPHVVDAFRGMLVTAHMFVRGSGDFREFYRDAYSAEPVVRVQDKPPDFRDVRGSDRAVIGGFEEDGRGRLVVVCAIDNLGKGAAGQAVQNMNLLLGFPETQGLRV